ncbi:hypothetical protein CHLRE_01g006766v5 [Chlamydomonas reinhardtii]|uniref:Reverse transcriptase domain-containing protein n=1 Tax=Chlamydomonas reinhardtii TaxID=3055 RepID=A0A2K3E543_CHLRE|nr:uncharacterized protein CHLRE_01g006766v5 [Chlamydomonas reinhardtii]PNW87911.1 hypothetical protein CHLRE_01g006766v5 [Chlamydomonas reinhardtii]
MAPLPCPLPTLSTILQDLPRGGALGKRDVASAFHHIILDPSARRYMAFRHPVTNAIQRWVVLPFGASQSPAIWVELATAACAIFQAECDCRGLNIKIHVYADDFMLLGATHADITAAFEVMDTLGAELGLEWKASKDVGRDQHLQQLDFLGMCFDTVRMEMRISPEKRARYASAAQDLLAAAGVGPVSTTDLLSVTGKLAFIAQACRWGPSFLQGLYDSVPPPSHRPSRRTTITTEGIDDLRFWCDLLDSSTSPWDGVRRCVVADLDVVLGEYQGPGGAVVYTDASAAGFGAVWEQAELQGGWQPDERGVHIAWLELKAIVRALQSWAPRLAGRRVLVRCDNTQAVAALNRGSTRVRDGRGLMRQVAALALQHDFQLRALHIAGVDNGRADRLSRQLAAAEEQNLSLVHSVYRQACRRARLEPEVDCCCDVLGLNRQPGCHTFFSPAASVLDHAEQLAGRAVWAFPPHSIAGEVLGLLAGLRDTGTRALVLVPDWRDRGWYRVWLAAAAYPGGVFVCRRCLLAEAQLGGIPDAALEELAAKAVAAAGNAVADSSAETYLSHRRRLTQFAEQVLRLPAQQVFPRGPGADINRAHVCLFLAWAVRRYAISTINGSTAERAQDSCWLVLGFFGMLRRSELAGLQLRDVREVPGGGVELFIRRSKTDQRGCGAAGGRGFTPHISSAPAPCGHGFEN